MRIDLGEKLLFEHIGQVEASQSVVLVDESVELDEVDLVSLAGGIVEGLLEAVVDLGDLESNLLNGGEFPVDSARGIETSTHGCREHAMSLTSGRADVRADIVDESLEV